jgi:hypothetical protein
MQQTEKTGMPFFKANPSISQKIMVTPNWMPASGYGPYCTIPISSGIDSSLLMPCGLSSFIGARHDVKILAEEYAARAVELAVRARQERLDLSRQIRGLDGQQLLRPHRIRLCLSLDMPKGRLYLFWRGVVKRRGRLVRIRARMWDCQADLTPLIADAHPAEELLMRRLEAEAAELRRHWFALVRMIHYMNVVEEHRLADLESGRIQTRNVGRFAVNVMRRLHRAFRSRGPLSQLLRNRTANV